MILIQNKALYVLGAVKQRFKLSVSILPHPGPPSPVEIHMIVLYGKSPFIGERFLVDIFFRHILLMACVLCRCFI